jgi:type IV secretion system protein VirD4
MKDLIGIMFFAGVALSYFGTGKYQHYGFGLLGFVGLYFYYTKVENPLSFNFPKFKGKSENKHGSASFATRRDLKQLLRPASTPLQPGELSLAPFVSLFRNEVLYLPREETVKHLLLIGAAGSGKSRSFFLPNCAFHVGSFICTDPKSELWRHTSGYAKSIRFAPRDPDNSYSFNWIPLCADSNTALLCARALVSASGGSSSDTFWEDSATSLIAAIFAHAATFPIPTPAAAYDFYNFYSDVELAEVLKNSKSITAQRFSKGFRDASPNTRGSIISTVDTKLNFLADEKVRRFTSTARNPIDFSALRREPIRIFLCLAENDVEPLKGLSCLFFTLCLYQVKSADGVPVTFFLDEAANIGKIPKLETEIAIVRGRDISMILGLQSFSQLSRIYGRDAAQVIIDNCATKVFLSGADIETAEMVSRSLGEKTITERAEDGREIKTQRRLLYPDEIRQIDRNEQLIINSNKKPLKTKRYFFLEPENEKKMPPLPEKVPEMKFLPIPKESPPPPPPMPDFD